MPELEDYTIMISVMCRNEEEVARALEAMARPAVGLILEGISVMYFRANNVPGMDE